VGIIYLSREKTKMMIASYSLECSGHISADSKVKFKTVNDRLFDCFLVLNESKLQKLDDNIINYTLQSNNLLELNVLQTLGKYINSEIAVLRPTMGLNSC
jgi:hypothetical protein